MTTRRPAPSRQAAAIVPLPCGRLVARQRSDGRGRVTGTTRGGPVAKQAPKKPRAASKAAASDKARTAAELERLTPRKLTREQLIEALNDDLAWEYQALIQYVQHAAAISGAPASADKLSAISSKRCKLSASCRIRVCARSRILQISLAKNAMYNPNRSPMVATSCGEMLVKRRNTPPVRGELLSQKIRPTVANVARIPRISNPT